MIYDSVGIKGWGLYVPPFRVDVRDLASALKASPAETDRLLQIIGPHKSISIPGKNMDSIVLALNAVHEMNEPLTNVEVIYGGTEGAPDMSKPTMAHYIAELFNIGPNIQVLHSTGACCVGGNLLLEARNHSLLNNKNALVALGDIAQYGDCEGVYKKSATQGCGGAAFLVGPGEDLITLSKPGLEGTYAINAKDFWVPRDSEFPKVDGLLSCFCQYLGVSGAILDHFRKLDQFEEKSVKARLSSYKMVVVHAPFINQVRDSLCLTLGDFQGLEKAVMSELKVKGSGKEAVFNMLDEARSAENLELYEELIQMWNQVPLTMGNSYSVSVPAALMYGIQNFEEPGQALVVFFGSGAQAIAMSVYVSEAGLEYANRLDVKKMIHATETIDAATYLKGLNKQAGEFTITDVTDGYITYGRV